MGRAVTIAILFVCEVKKFRLKNVMVCLHFPVIGLGVRRVVTIAIIFVCEIKKFRLKNLVFIFIFLLTGFGVKRKKYIFVADILSGN